MGNFAENLNLGNRFRPPLVFIPIRPDMELVMWGNTAYNPPIAIHTNSSMFALVFLPHCEYLEYIMKIKI